MVSDPEHTRQIGQQYSGKMVIMYDRILQHRKGVLMLFEVPDRTKTEQYYNSKIKKGR